MDLKLTFANTQVLLTMDSGKRKTQKYSFKDPKIYDLMSLIPEIESSTDFWRKCGHHFSYEAQDEGGYSLEFGPVL